MLVGCSAPAPADLTLSLVSDEGLLEAEVRVAAPVERGQNELYLELRPRDAGASARLVAVDATMAVHAHEAHAASIEPDGDGFRAGGLDLFMTGRWLVELELQAGERRDTASFPIDVP